MTIALIIITTLLGLIAVGSALGKLTANPKVVEIMRSVGVSDAQTRILAVLEILGAAGLAVGIFVPALGMVSAIALTLYFVGAIVATLQSNEGPVASVPPLVITLLAIATSWLELQR